MSVLIGLAILAVWGVSARAAAALAPRVGYGSPEERGYWRSYGWTVGPFAVVHALALIVAGPPGRTQVARPARSRQEATDLVVESARAAAATVGTAAFAKLAGQAVKLTGTEIARHVRDTDAPGLLSPLVVVREGTDRLGAILALQDRAILAWTVGTVRITNFETVIPYRSIESLAVGTRPGGALTKPRETLRIDAGGETYDLTFANVFENGRSIVPFIEGMLEGSITLVFEDA